MRLRANISCLLVSIFFPLSASGQPTFNVESFCTEAAGGSYRIYQVCVEDELRAQTEVVQVQNVPLEPFPTPAAEKPSLQKSGSPTEPERIVACDFENMPLVLMRFRGGMGASDNTVQIGNASPLSLSVGSGLMSASDAPYDYTFSLHEPATVSVHHLGDSNSRTFYGECISAN